MFSYRKMLFNRRVKGNNLPPNEKPTSPNAELDKTHPLAVGLVGCWIFNEGSGATYFDLTDSANHGTENGAVIRDTQATHGTSVRTDGVDQDARIELGLIDSNNPISFFNEQEMSYYMFTEDAVAAGAQVANFAKTTGGGTSGGYMSHRTPNEAETFTTNGVASDAGANFYLENNALIGVGGSVRTSQTRFFKNGSFIVQDNDFKIFLADSVPGNLLNLEGAGGGGGQPNNAKMFCIYLWNRYLTDSEHTTIHGDRYRFIIF